MELGEYKQRNGRISGAAQAFVDTHFPVCPLCGGTRPAWALKYAARPGGCAGAVPLRLLRERPVRHHR